MVRGGRAARAARRGGGAALTALAGLALALGACAVGGPAGPGTRLPPPVDALATAPETTLPGAEAPLPAAVWAPEGPPRAVILALHGYGDHAASAFGEVAESWAREGIAVYAYDHRGFGRGADRGRWAGADGLLADAEAAAAAVAPRAGDAPFFMLGESMGGGVALALVGEGRAPEVDGLILVAPAIATGDRIGPLSRAALWTLAGLLPDRRWSGEGLVTIQASDDLAMLRALGADPLYLGEPSAREMLGLVRLMDRASAAAEGVAVPTLLLLGERDELIDVDAAERAAGRIPAPVEARRYPEGWHMLLRDLQKARVWRDVADWTLGREGTGG